MEHIRVKILVRGIVQGVGFRPFVYSLANSLDLKGFVMNSSEGVIIEIEGDNNSTFIERLTREAPPLAQIMEVDITPMPYYGYQDFQIIKSEDAGRFTHISPDVSICDDCLRELLDKDNRRYLYPFINCTNCGPRYTITRSIPYDRPNTTMSVFKMCAECEDEYHSPVNRRFHAQPNACPICGPQLEFEVHPELNSGPKFKVNETKNPIEATIGLLKQGAIVAIKGLGGFHVACDATNEEAVNRLRLRKRKNNKPFALMAPDIEIIKKFCEVSKEEERLLISNKRPIVLLKKREDLVLPDAIAPNNPCLGFMLPYTPLHYLLFFYPNSNENAIARSETPSPVIARDEVPKQSHDRLGAGSAVSNDEIPRRVYPEQKDKILRFAQNDMRRAWNDRLGGLAHFNALIMTSGNLAEEPIVIDNDEAISRLSEIVDAFLLHNRDIFMRVDDSVMRHKLFIRRSRGYVPDPIPLYEDGPEVLGCGADIKNTFTLTKGSFAIPSQHIGDMENYETLSFFEESLENLKSVYRVNPIAIGYDLHPNYLSTQWALTQGARGKGQGVKSYGIQHHYAHIASVMAEKDIKRKVIGIAFDGTGYGTDGNLWGGEFLIADIKGFKRVGHFKYIPLPGGEMAIKEPWRIAVAYVKDIAGSDTMDYLKSIGFIERYGNERLNNILRICDKRPFSPLSSGVGRLFDAVSAILGICDKNTFEGEAAMALESITKPDVVDDYPADIKLREPIEIDFSQTILRIINDLVNGVDKSIIASNFHNTVATVILRVVQKLSSIHMIKEVVLSGGVFQNIYLLERTIARLKSIGMEVYINEKVPCNDAGISLGQVYILRERIKNEKHS